jgi:phage N-6-adenine-methyltransferase
VKRSKGAPKKTARGSKKTTALAKRAGVELDIERARELLRHTHDVDLILDIRDAAQLSAAYHKLRGSSLAAINDALEIVLRAQRRFGEFLCENGLGKGRPPQNGPAGTFSLKSLKVSRKEAARCRKLAKAEELAFEQHIATVRAKGERLTMSGSLAATSDAPEYDSDEWYTPADRIDLVREVLGTIDLDPCSCIKAQTGVGAALWYGKKDNGLEQDWEGAVFLNPPYSDPAPWITKLLEHHEDDDVPAAIVLVNNTTDTVWCQELLAHCAAVCFTKGRIAFLREDGNAVIGARQGQAFFYLGPDATLFADVFADVGAVLIPDERVARPAEQVEREEQPEVTA